MFRDNQHLPLDSLLATKTSRMSSESFRVGIVGGGLVGALEACLLARRGFDVTLFESRHDGRNEPSYYGRSINLAISLRGRSALKRLGYDYVVDERAIPMKARMIHNKSGDTNAIPYDPDGRCIYSIERAGLNNFLLDKAEQVHKIDIKFNHVLVDMNAETGELAFKIRQSNSSDSKDKVENDNNKMLHYYKFDLVLGCDGARSSVRSLLARQSQQMETSQTFIEHGYLELRIDPNADGSYKLPPNYLHIWPRGQYMMIALPNKDSSFTCTLFMPYKILGEIQDPEKALDFFRRQFNDSVDLIGEQRIMETLANIRPSSLISIKCKPYHHKDKVALLGDSAHAMVPFYGQGMNCGFEDCLTLDELFDQFEVSWGNTEKADREKVGLILQEYTNRRCPNGQAMCELAMYNYIEMRDLVNSWSFKARKHLDNLLYRLFPSYWIPLYTMVTFSRIPIDECVRRRARQDKILFWTRTVAYVPLGLVAMFMLIVILF